MVASIFGALIGWGYGSRFRSPSQAAATSRAPQPSWVTARAESRVLTSTVVMRGDVTPEAVVTVGAPSSVHGPAVVTQVPPDADSVVEEGTLLVAVSDRPVFALWGALPAFRSIEPGMEGPDVAQLQAALRRLGYSPDSTGRFGEDTKLAVAQFYQAAGFDPVPSATTSQDVLTARLDLLNASETLAAAEDALEIASTSDRPAALAERDIALAVRDAATAALETARDAYGPTVPMGEVAFIPIQPVRILSAVTVLGAIKTVVSGDATGGEESSLVTVSAGTLVVSSAVNIADDALVRVGMAVELIDEGTSSTYTGVIATIADRPTLDLTGVMSRLAMVLPDEPLPASVVAHDLRVVVTSAASDGEVLVVPVAAVSTDTRGDLTVSVLDPDSPEPRVVVVSVGLTADGFAAVTPTTPELLVEGDLVVVGR